MNEIVVFRIFIFKQTERLLNLCTKYFFTEFLNLVKKLTFPCFYLDYSHSSGLLKTLPGLMEQAVTTLQLGNLLANSLLHTQVGH